MMERNNHPDFFIHYLIEDRLWAEWITWQLEEAGYTTVSHALKFQDENRLFQELDTAAKRAKYIIAVISLSYLRNFPFNPDARNVSEREQKLERLPLLPVRVRPCDLKETFGQVFYLNLVGQEEQEANTRLLASVGCGKVFCTGNCPGKRRW